jgi:dipeptidyl aminopeptidase/acylaminoacyl peptidase
MVLAGLLLALAGGLATAAAQDQTMVPIPENIVAKNVPPIPRQRVEDLLPYENIRTATFVEWHPRERRMIIGTRFAQSVQLHEVAMPMGARTQLTFHNDPVGGGTARPSDPSQLVFGLNEGGAENIQFFLLDRKTGRARRFTDGKSRNLSPTWSRDGKLLAYVNNSRNGRDSDLYVEDPAVEGSERRVVELQGSWNPLDWSHDNQRLLLEEGISANESYLHWVDVASGKLHTITPRGKKGDPPVAYQGALWSRDGRSIYTLTDRDSEFLRLVRLDLESGRSTVLSGDIPWDVETADLSEDGRLLAFFVNEDGFSKLHVIDAQTGAALPVPELPAGTVGGMEFRPGSHEIGFSMSWAKSPSDVYSYDADTRKLERWTASEAGGLNTEQFALPQLIRYPTFDEASPGVKRTIPAFIYRPPAGRFQGPRPVYVNIHGGPEGQARPNFLGSTNYFIDEMGVVLIYPNVRGSSGYGKTYLKMDNWEKREDSVKDIGALLQWIASQPDLDASRVMVGGGSYGGYMVLASLVHYGDRIRCAFESVGISNFVTFLENTSEYRRDLRRVEYGDERIPEMRAFLEKIAPARQASRITRPLLVAQGANDPRVPLSESDQIVKAVEGNGAPVWYIVAKDEGHGFQKKDNSDYLRVALVEFMRQHLLGQEAMALTPNPSPGGRGENLTRK